MEEQESKMKTLIATACLTLLLAAGNVNASPSTYIDMDITPYQPTASLSYDGNPNDSLVGSSIAIDYLEGFGMPQNSNTQVALQSAFLNFNTGALTSISSSNGTTTWYFGSGGSINITGESATLGITNVSTLLTGQFNQSTVMELADGTFKFAIIGSTFNDSKNPAIYQYFQFPNYFCTSGMNFSFQPGTTVNPDAISSQMIYSGDIENDPIIPTPIPAAAWLLGSGLMGLLGLRRKEKA